ncbi:YbaB/EbfC family nucleoid-associated protein [bacterium]|nr:YbaB/EbfC family nucleoid-associated protein [bacterium]
MFDKLKKIKELKQVQDELAEEKISVEKQGIEVVVNGKMEIIKITLNLSLPKDALERTLKECINEAVNKVQIVVARKLSNFRGLGL